MDRKLFEGILFGNPFVVTPWKVLAWTGVMVFAARWGVQAWASKRAGMSVTPRLFWYMSIFGSLTQLLYFIFGKMDSVGILGNAFPAAVSVYNLYLSWKSDRVVKTIPEPPALELQRLRRENEDLRAELNRLRQTATVQPAVAR